MATWKYKTLALSVLPSGLASGGTSVSVDTGDGALFPTGGDFWISIDNGTEIVKVGGRTSDSLTSLTRGQEGTSDVTHAAGVSVALVVTAASLDQMRQDIHQTGADASKSAEKAGNLYLPNNGVMLYRDTGSAFLGWGPVYPFTPPDDSIFSWINQGSASLSTTPGGIYVQDPAHSGENWRIRKYTAPATPYVITAAFSCILMANAKAGIGFRQSSDGKLHALILEMTGGNFQLASHKMTNPTTYSANYATSTGQGPAVCITKAGSLCWFRIADNGTSRICSVSLNGNDWIVFHTVGRTDFLTADEVMFFINAGSTAADAAIQLMSWKQT